MIDKINNNQIQDILEIATSKQPHSPTTSKVDADVSLQTDYASLLEKAIQNQQTDTISIQQAEKLLISGNLESPENILAAAENIIMFGI